MVNESVSAVLLNLIRRSTGATDFCYKPETVIERDMGVYGDDAVDLLMDYSTTFGVDVSNFHFSRYFSPEGFYPFHRLSPKSGLRIEDLEKGILVAKLDESVIKADLQLLRKTSFRYFEFTMTEDDGSHFRVATNVPKVIARVCRELKQPLDNRSAHICGTVSAIEGLGNPWAWHFLPNNWELVEHDTELCDDVALHRLADNSLHWPDGQRVCCLSRSRVLREVFCYG